MSTPIIITICVINLLIIVIFSRRIIKLIKARNYLIPGDKKIIEFKGYYHNWVTHFILWTFLIFSLFGNKNIDPISKTIVISFFSTTVIMDLLSILSLLFYKADRLVLAKDEITLLNTHITQIATHKIYKISLNGYSNIMTFNDTNLVSIKNMKPDQVKELMNYFQEELNIEKVKLSDNIKTLMDNSQ